MYACFFTIRVCGNIVAQTQTHTHWYMYIYSYPSCHHSIFIFCTYATWRWINTHYHTTPYIYMYYHFPVDEQNRRWLNFPYTFFSSTFTAYIYIFTRAKVSVQEDNKRRKEKDRVKKKNKPLNPSHRDFIWNTNHMVWLCCAVCSVLCVLFIFTATNITLWTLPHFAPSNIADVFDLSVQNIVTNIFVCEYVKLHLLICYWVCFHLLLLLFFQFP